MWVVSLVLTHCADGLNKVTRTQEMTGFGPGSGIMIPGCVFETLFIVPLLGLSYYYFLNFFFQRNGWEPEL